MPQPGRTPAPKISGRLLAVQSLAESARQYPDMVPEPGAGFDAAEHDQDARLSLRIIRTTLRHWLTIEHLLNTWLRQPVEDLEPNLQAVLLTGGAQLLYLPDLPTHSVVDESVKIASDFVRPGAKGMVNAVLRRLAEAVGQRLETPWVPGVDSLPTPEGHIKLVHALFEGLRPQSRLIAVCTSHPESLVITWEKNYGKQQALELAMHSVKTPPQIVAVEPGFDTTLSEPVEKPDWQPHAFPGFIVWSGGHAKLKSFLSGHMLRRVQDPASASVVESTRSLKPKVIVDACAGRGTKTRQLAWLHPEAKVIASDTDRERMNGLRQSLKPYPNARAVLYGMIGESLPGGRADLVLLDVPCSNTGVLARRIEARYRYSLPNIQQLVMLQRKIIREQARFIRPGGHLLYSTCSIDPMENQQQARWIIENIGGELVTEHLLLPGGELNAYHDGSYHALIRL